MPSAAAQDVLQAILEQRAAEKRREMAVPPAGPPAVLPFANRIAGAFEAAAPVRQVDELSTPITLPFAARNQLGDWHGRMPNVVKTFADPRTSPLGPAAVARLFMDPAEEVGRQVETGEELAKPFTQFNDPNVDPVKQAADLTLATMGGSSVVPAAANELRMGIKAYHGSPHDFERFDSSKIGTGEGAQAYGHGLYMAENEAVAGEYKKSLAQTVTVDGKPLLQNNKIVGTTGRKSVDDELVAHHGDLEAAISNLEAHVSTLTPGQAARGAADDLAALKALRGRVSTANTGKMYEVDIAADPEHFLDWDKPLSEQPAKVSEGLNQILKDRERMPAEWIKSSPGAEQRMSEAGIPGIRYLDQGSRGAVDVNNIRGTISMLETAAKKHPEDASLQQRLVSARQQLADAEKGLTSNYVVFDDKLISILKKYGLPISAAGLAALSQLHPQEAQAAQKQRQ